MLKTYQYAKVQYLAKKSCEYNQIYIESDTVPTPKLLFNVRVCGLHK